MRSMTPQWDRGSPISDRRLFHRINKHRRRSAQCKRRILRNGGQLSRQPASRRNETAARATPLLNHLVGAGDERGWHSEAERLGYRNIDDEIEFGRLLDRDVPWLHPAQYLVHKIAGAAEQVWIIWSIRHQTARFDELPYTCDRRQPRDIGQGEDANPITVQERIGRNIKRFREPRRTRSE